MRASKFMKFIAAILLCRVGCASSEPKYHDVSVAVQPRSAELVVYVPDHYARGGITFLLHLVGKQIARPQDAGVTAVRVSPGNHELESSASAMHSSSPMKLPAETQAGQRLFFRFDKSPSRGIVISSHTKPVPITYSYGPVPEAEALVEIKKLNGWE